MSTGFFSVVFVSHKYICLFSYKPTITSIQARQRHVLTYCYNFPAICLVVLHTYEKNIFSPCSWFYVTSVLHSTFLKFWMWKIWLLKHRVVNTRVLDSSSSEYVSPQLHSCFLKQPQNRIQVLNKEAGFPPSWILETPDNQQLFKLNQSKWGCFSSEPWSSLESCFGYLCKKTLPQGSISAQASLLHRGKMKINYMGLQLSSYIRLVNVK